MKFTELFIMDIAIPFTIIGLFAGVIIGCVVSDRYYESSGRWFKPSECKIVEVQTLALKQITCKHTVVK